MSGGIAGAAGLLIGQVEAVGSYQPVDDRSDAKVLSGAAEGAQQKCGKLDQATAQEKVGE